MNLMHDFSVAKEYEEWIIPQKEVLPMSYTQPPPMTEEEMESFFQEAKIARFCSLNKNGTIHAVPVWFKYSDGKFLIGAAAKSRRVRNIKRNKNVTLLIDIEAPHTRAVIIYGEAEIKRDDIEDLAVRIFERYMPHDEAVVYQRGLFKLTTWIGLIVTPKKMTSFDYGKDTQYRAATKDEL
ncbi:MAG: pyridoxamine 5'-phosphate oxidase family protein [Candidatus Thorarchaeota archaeon]|nr:pyridoxamine 5'-phosphate oxidase family protein [Candidatus Thorarchaeota archaeon]